MASLPRKDPWFKVRIGVMVCLRRFFFRICVGLVWNSRSVSCERLANGNRGIFLISDFVSSIEKTMQLQLDKTIKGGLHGPSCLGRNSLPICVFRACHYI